jgi:hypothetical protein
MSKFSLANVARSGRALTRQSSSTPVVDTSGTSLTPKVSAIIEGPRPPKVRRRQATAEVVVAIYPYTRDAASIWEGCSKPGLTLWQAQVDHAARNSITIGFYESFTKFLQQEEGAPDSLQELADKALIKLVLADRKRFAFCLITCVAGWVGGWVELAPKHTHENQKTLQF